jgi:hypothetical protein
MYEFHVYLFPCIIYTRQYEALFVSTSNQGCWRELERIDRDFDL